LISEQPFEYGFVLLTKKTMKLRMVWLIALLGTGTLLAQKSKDTENVRKTLTLDPFQSIGLAISADVEISYGKVQRVEVAGPPHLVNDLTTEVRKGNWSIEYRSKNRSKSTLTLYITLPELRELAVAGSGQITMVSAFPAIDKLSLSIAGSGKITVLGETDKLQISIAGSGRVNADALISGTGQIDIAGSGHARVDTRESLKVSIAGSGSVAYKGRPKISSSIAGSGSVKTLD
jgi:hypothetical protein